jgi:hypothetical protein
MSKTYRPVEFTNYELDAAPIEIPPGGVSLKACSFRNLEMAGITIPVLFARGCSFDSCNFTGRPVWGRLLWRRRGRRRKTGKSEKWMLGVFSKGEATLSLDARSPYYEPSATSRNYEFISSNGELDPRSPNGPFCRESLPYPGSAVRLNLVPRKRRVSLHLKQRDFLIGRHLVDHQGCPHIRMRSESLRSIG